MKKLLVVSLMLGLLTACGEKVPTTSKSYKKELLQKVYEKNDVKAKEEYQNIIAELEEIAGEGSEKADREIERWEEIDADFQAKALQRMSKETEALARKFKNKKGNGW